MCISFAVGGSNEMVGYIYDLSMFFVLVVWCDLVGSALLEPGV